MMKLGKIEALGMGPNFCPAEQAENALSQVVDLLKRGIR